MCCEEPFRLFFPLGVLVGISGVSLWPLFFAGLHKFYPGIMHARLMIEGFLGAFVIGFLATAGPRLTGTPHLSRGELGSFVLLYAGAVGTHIAHRHFTGDLIFLALILAFAVRMAGRFARREVLPPPSFVLVGIGFANVIVGTVLLIIAPLGEGFPRCQMLGSLLLYQAFVLHLVLGIGGFLLPRLLRLLPAAELPDSKTPTPAWSSRALFAAAIGVALLASFIVEVFTTSPRLAAIIRFSAIAVFLASDIPLHRTMAPRLTITRCLRLALVLLPLGVLAAAFWPAQRVAAEHLVFIGGFTLLTFTVAIRVVFGHSGNSHLFTDRLPFLMGTAVLLVFGAGFRFAGDFLPAWRTPLLNAASYAWMLAAAWWAWRVLPKVRVADSE